MFATIQNTKLGGHTMFRGLSMLILIFLCLFASPTAGDDDTMAVDIGIIYDEYGDSGKMGFNSIQLALSEFYNSHGYYKTRIALHTRLYHPNDGIVGAASAAVYLLKYKEVKAIIEATTSMDAEFVIQLGERAQVPIISYLSTSPCVLSNRCSYYLSLAQKDSAQVQAITALIQAFQWKDVIPIYADNNEYGVGIIPYLDDALQKINARIPSHEVISVTATDDQIVHLLRKLKAMQTRVFVVHLSPMLASRVFLLANELKMMGKGYVWIATTRISNELGSLDENVIESMQGVVGVQTYVPQTEDFKLFKSRWELKFPYMKLDVMGLWAYDTACALARAVEQITAPKSGFKTTKMQGNEVTDIDSVGVSPVGPELLKALRNTTSFTGLAADGEIGLSPSYRIINVFGGGSNEVGFWTSQRGLVPNLKSNVATSSSKPSLLRPIIWPGDETKPPKGWEIPADGKMLRVGIPVKPVYEQLVNVTHVKGINGSPNSTIITGLCIDIFDTVMKNLGYSHHYRYFPFEKPDGEPAGTYDELVYKVFLQEYDVVVGDVTIIADRSSYVDFTLPYTESGVTMVVPVRDDKQRSAWVFLKPLTWELWFATLCAFLFIAFAIWVLEHRINEEFRGPPLHQAGTCLFYSFSMMVFAQKENVVSNLTRYVVVVWVFVVLVLTQSYTASLSSILTVQRLRPTVSGIDELLSTGAYVGFQDESFVKNLLIQKGFHESKIVSYNSSDNLADLLSKGSGNGGIAAVFDEIPYMKLFTAAHPSKYIMMQPLYKTDGFGFAFPKGSPLASEVSGGILRVTEGNNMSTIERKWGMQEYNNTDEGNIATSASLSLESFSGLFLIVGVAIGSAIFIFLVQFLYEQRHIWMNSDASVWSRTRMLAKAFQSRDMAAHTFRKRDDTTQTQTQTTHNVETDHTSFDGDGDTPTNTNIPPRLSNYSDRVEENLSISAIPSPTRLQLDSD